MLWRLFLDVQAVVSYLGVGILMYWLALRLQPDIRGGDGNFAIILLWPVVMPFCLIFFGLPALDRLCRVIERKSEPAPGAPEPEPEKTAEELRREADEDLAAALAGMEADIEAAEAGVTAAEKALAPKPKRKKRRKSSNAKKKTDRRDADAGGLHGDPQAGEAVRRRLSADDAAQEL